ncbi:MAG: cysteine desulfurase-like protein [Actinomycetota bacterium]|jgi:cysteine desulfurase family protein (TIGR01976 family)|nr:cysteine desulfurase-like protein [Actinomycetota bacterium]
MTSASALLDSTGTLDVERVRARFPALAPTANGRRVVHADAPGGTQVTRGVIEAMSAYLRDHNANSHGGFPTSAASDAMVGDVRTAAAGFLGGWLEGIVFGPNMTTLTWHFSHALDPRVGSDDELVVTHLDHDANVSPWLKLAERTGARLRWVELDPASGRLNLDTLAVSPRTRLVAFPAASNALGTVVDPAPFVAAARSVGALTFCDAVHAAPHVPLSQRADGIDVLVCSPYKFFGPHAGLLSADPALLAELRPDKVRPAPDEGPDRWQTGTATFEAIAGIGAALDHVADLGMDTIGAHERALSQRFLDGLSRLDAVALHGPPDAAQRTPTFAVTVRGHTPAQVAAHLAGRDIYTWAGHYYALEPMRALGLLDAGGAVRIGFVHYHGAEDVDRVLQALADLN